ncbi:hypothetical protein diail_7513, partial [Diaporthe ilicicola]
MAHNQNSDASAIPTDSLSDGSAQGESEKAGAPAPPAFPDGGLRAWSVAAGHAGAMFCTFGYINSFGIYEEYYASHQLKDSSSSAISWIGSLNLFFVFVGTLFGGPMFDRYGGKVILPAALVYVFSIMMTSLCNELWQFILAQGLLGGISLGMTMGPANAATPQYFQKKRGAAVGLAVAGSSVGGVIFPIALGKMFDNPNVGFAWAVRICGFIILAVLGPSSLLIRARLPPRKSNLFLPAAFKDVQFLSLTAALFCLFLGMFVPIFYIPTYAVSQGMSSGLAFYLVAILNAASLPGRILPGIISDKLGRLNCLVLAAATTGIVILCWSRVHSNAAIIVWAAAFGFTSGAIFSAGSVSFASVPKDPRNIGTYMGMGLGTSSVAALIGPPVNGALVSTYGGYDQVAIFSGVFCLAGAAFTLIAKW